MSKLVIAEKPSVALSLAKVLGAYQRQDGYMEGNGYLVSWCVGHLVGLAQPDVYDETYGNKYDVIWNPWKNETGMTGTICYAKQNENEKYSVSCGTGP